MALDIHIGASKAKAEKLYPSLSLEEEIHEVLFNSDNKWINKLLWLKKMEDYYKDVFYSYEDLGELKKEIKEVVPKFKDKRVVDFLEQFLKVCNLAEEKANNIYCFSD